MGELARDILEGLPDVPLTDAPAVELETHLRAVARASRRSGYSI